MIEIFNDKEFKELPVDEQKRIGLNYFNSELADEEFNSLSEDEKQNIYNNFLESEIGIQEGVSTIQEDKQSAEYENLNEYEKIDYVANESRQKLKQAIKDNPELKEQYSKSLLAIDESVANKKLALEKKEVERLKLQEAKEKLSKRADSTFDRVTDVIEGQGRGALRMVLGTGKLGQDVLGKLTHEEYNLFDKWISENEQVIKDKGLEGDALVGEIMSNILPVARLRSLGYVMGAEGLMAGTASLGSGETYQEAGTKAAIATVGAGVTGKIFNKFFPDTPIDEVDTSFKKQIDKLDIDDQNRINSILDNLDKQGITKMDAEARETILGSVFAGKKSTAEISKDVVRRLKAQAKVANKKVSDAYDEANAIAREIEVNDKVKFDYTPRDADEAQLYKNIKAQLKPKYNRNLEELEVTIQKLKKKKGGATGSDKHMYGKAIEAAQKKQDELGGVGIYKNARKLSKEYNTEYTGIIKQGEEATAGATTARVIEKDFSEEAGEFLIGRDVNLNKIGKAALNMKPKQRQQVIQDLLTKNLKEEEMSSPEGVRKILSNYKLMNPKGLTKFLGKEEANKIAIQMKSLNEIELAIKSAKGQALDISDDVLALATAGATAKLSPYLAARSTIYASKNIVKKFSKSAEKAKLIERIRKIEDTRTRTVFMKAVGLGFSSIANFKPEEEK